MAVLCRDVSVRHLPLMLISLFLYLDVCVSGQSSFLNPDSLPNTTALLPDGVQVVGYEFQALQNTVVVSLGRTFVPTDDSLADVAIILYEKTDRTLLATTVYSSGQNNAALTAPVQLLAGSQYVIEMTVLNGTAYPSFPFNSASPDMFDMKIAVITQALTGDSQTEMATTASDVLQGIPNFFAQSDFSTAVEVPVATLAVTSAPLETISEQAGSTEEPVATPDTSADTVVPATSLASDETPNPSTSTIVDKTSSASQAITENISTDTTAQASSTTSPSPTNEVVLNLVEPTANTVSDPVVTETTNGEPDDKITGAGIAAVAITTVVCVGIVVLSVVIYKWHHRYKSSRRGSDISELRINSTSGVYPQSPDSGFRAESGHYLGFRSESGQHLNNASVRNTQPV